MDAKQTGKVPSVVPVMATHCTAGRASCPQVDRGSGTGPVRLNSRGDQCHSDPEATACRRQLPSAGPQTLDNRRVITCGHTCRGVSREARRELLSGEFGLLFIEICCAAGLLAENGINYLS